MDELISELKRIVGPRGFLTDPASMEAQLTEWRGTWSGSTPILLRPNSTQQVSSIVAACAAARVPIVPQGGNTGLCGGAIPDAAGEQILLCLGRMNRLLDVDPEDFSMTVQAGMLLADVQAAALEANRYFPLSLAAEGSCQIGGNLSTNAGGTSVLRYGTARDQVLGLEVVLPDGRVWNGLRRLRKDTAGYDLKQLFIGSEGTLGIITAATLKLYPDPGTRQVAMIALNSATDAIALLAMLRSEIGDQIQAFELMSRLSLEFVLRHTVDARQPFDALPPWTVLLDVADGDGGAAVEQALMMGIERELAVDAVIAKSDRESAVFWELRHAVSEAQKHEGASLKHDVSVPVSAVARFIERAERAVLESAPGARVVAFGHVGDGNVHFNISQPVDSAANDFLARRDEIAAVVYDVVRDFDGSISAEHGVGVLKRDVLPHYRGELDVELMRTVKRALDPENLLNPGKVVDFGD